MKKTPRNNSHATNACTHCRRRKTRCDGGTPACGACVRKSEDCAYTPDSDRRTARGRACAELEAENERLRAQLSKYEYELASAAPAPPRTTEDKPQTAAEASRAAVPRVDTDEQLSFPGQPFTFDLFPLADAQLLEFYPPTHIEPRWLQEPSTLAAVHSECDPLQACTQPAFPPAPGTASDAQF